MSRRDLRGDAGSSTILALGLIAALLTVTLGGLAVLSAMRAAHVARSSADLAALAGAGHYQLHADAAAACGEARRIARRHEVDVVDCRVASRGDVTVTTSAPITHRLAGVGPPAAEGTARAGPEPAP